MNWEDVKTLRKEGKLQQAKEVALKILVEDPRNIQTKFQYEWVIYDFIKQNVTKIEESLNNNKPINDQDLRKLMDWMNQYRDLKPQMPGMACSNILTQLLKVGHRLPKLPHIIKWVGIERLREEDWQPTQFNEKTIKSLALKIAQALCKWVKGYPEASQVQMELALEWAQKVLDKTKDDDALWLKWNVAIILRKMGHFHRALELLSFVIKAKRNEAFVWAEAGRLYEKEQPDLAISCFCRALECPSKPEYQVKTHLELGKILATQKEYAQASREIALTIEIRKKQGWSIGRDIDALTANSWYDSEAKKSEDPKYFYARHASEALTLTFDIVETKKANYLGSYIQQTPKDPRPGWKPKIMHRFVVKDSKGQSFSLITSNMKKQNFIIGEPVKLVVGGYNGDTKQNIAHVLPRHDGSQWDCLEPSNGVITSAPLSEKSVKVLLVETGDEMKVEIQLEQPLEIGQGVKCGIVRNPKNNRIDVLNLERVELSHKQRRFFTGKLRRDAKGFGLVEKAFVPPNIVKSIDSNLEEVTALAVYAKNPAKGNYGWRVVEIKATTL